MEEIRLKIQNINNEVYQSIDLRKFFYMAFIGDNGKTLVLYIATVFGGNTTIAKNQIEAGTKIQYNPRVDCSLDFQFSGGESYAIENLTENFCNQRDQVKTVWGESTQIHGQKELKETLTSQYKELYEGNEQAVQKIAHIDASQNLYSFAPRKTLSGFVVAPGELKDDKNDFSKGKYTLKCPNTWPDGLEAINWIKTTITLPKGFSKRQAKNENQKKKISFLVEFDGIFFSPDFTWYFAPPRGFVVSQDSRVSFENKEEKNVLQSVADYTTVEFEQWVKRPESILQRKKTRLLFPDEAKSEKLKTISVSLQFENPHQHDNWQFFAGLLIAFLLAFCSDKTRINDYYSCLSEICKCTCQLCRCQSLCNALTIMIPVLLLLCFMILVMWPERTLPQNLRKQEKIQKVINISCWIGVVTSVASTIFLVVYVYVLWLLCPDFMSSTLGINCITNQKILFLSYLFAFIPSIIYLSYCRVGLKYRIYDFI